MLLLNEFCFAATGADTTIVGKIIQQFEAQEKKIIDKTRLIALELFGLCAILEIAWLGIQASLGRSEIGETIKNFCFTLLACGFFLAVINNYQEWTYKIVHGLEMVAGDIGNVELSSDMPFKKGLELVNYMWDAVKDVSFRKMSLILGLILSALICLVASCLITASVILIKAEALIAMGVACILVGLGGTNFFRDYAKNALRYVVSVGFKLLTMQLVIVIGFKMIEEVIKQSKNVDFATCVVAVGVSLIIYALVSRLPEAVAGIINGSHVGGGNVGAFKSIALGTGALAGGAAGLAVAGARNVGLAKQAANADGKTGLAAVGGTVSNLWQGMKSSAMNGGSMKDNLSDMLKTKKSAASERANKAAMAKEAADILGGNV